jgi:hypothetical protein
MWQAPEHLKIELNSFLSSFNLVFQKFKKIELFLHFNAY